VIAEGKAKTAQELAADQDVKPLAEGPGNPTGKNRNGDNVTIPKGNSASYLVRRLKRDAPQIAEALAKGEYPSARAAGIAAGLFWPSAVGPSVVTGKRISDWPPKCIRPKRFA
jgi:hypothetical protein